MATNPSKCDQSLLGGSLLEHARGLAELAFGSFTQSVGLTHARHLALLPAESLELDLDDPAQRQFGDYELLELLGEGGMGVVYRARQISLDREVAVKLLSAGPWASKEFIARFEREAQNAARMQHSGIVTIYEVGSIEGMQFFSMRLVSGESLSSRLRRGEKFTPREAAALMRTVAEAVGYAHSLGVLHLDLKSANVLLDETMQPYVADFGLARRLENALAVDNDEVSGTPAYMAPEQAQVRANKLTAATDIWGLGAILYELLTGHPPFRGETAQTTVKLVLEGQVRAPRRWNPALSLDLQAIVMRCLSRDPAERYPSARALADDLQRYIEGRPVQARPLNVVQRTARWATREPRLAATIACALVALVVGLVTTSWQWHRAKQNAVLAQTNADVAQHTLWHSRTAVAQREIAVGDAYPALENAAANLREMEARGDHDDAALERLRIGTVLANAPQLIDVIPIAGGDSGISTLAISPDAKTLAVATSDRFVHLVDIASGRESWKVATNDQSFGMRDIRNWPLGQLRFSADGRRLIAFTLDFMPGGAQSTMRLHYLDTVMIDVAAGKVVAPPKAFADFLATDYAGDGRYALLFDKHGGVQRWRTQPWSPAGAMRVLKDNIAAGTGDGIGPLRGEALLADHGGQVILVSNANLEFRSFDAESMRPLRSLDLDPAQGRATAWTLRHDGRELAIGTVSGRIVLWNLDTGVTAWLQPQLSGRIATLRFSADDSRLLALSNAPSELRVFDPRNHALVAEPVKLSADLSPNAEGGIGAQFGADADTLLSHHWDGGATLWQVPAPGFPLQPPVAIAPVMVAYGSRFALATDGHSRLLATADNGRVKLWRLRPPPLTKRVAAPMVADTLRFDGRHLVSVAGNRVSVFDVATERNVGSTIELPEPPTYSGLDGSGTRLIVIAGRELGCWNWRNGKACWPAISLPNSALRLSIAASASVLAVSTGHNQAGVFFEQVHLIDLALGRQRGDALDLRGPLGTLRLSDDGRRLLAWQDVQSRDAQANVLYLIDAEHATILHRFIHSGGPGDRNIDDARFLADGSIWTETGCRWNSLDCSQAGHMWHWAADGRLIAKPLQDGTEAGLLGLPDSRGIIDAATGAILPARGKPFGLVAPDSNKRDTAAALSADGRLIALATPSGVALTDILHNEWLLPTLRLPLPSHEMVQQLAFAPDGSRLVGRTTAGRWFQWPLVSDTRSVATIERSVSLRDLSGLDGPPSPMSAAERQQLRASDPGPAPMEGGSDNRVVDAGIAVPRPDARYDTLDLDPIANVDPRAPMNHATRLPPQPQNLPSLPRGLQSYDGVDFLFGGAVQLSGKPQNLLDAKFPAASRELAVGGRHIAAIDALVMQYVPKQDTVGSIQLHYVDGGERTLAIVSPRDTVAHWMDAPTVVATRRIGWLGSYAAQLLIYVDGSPEASAGETLSRSYVVHLVNPEPDRAVASISLGAPPAASPGLLFLAVTLEPDRTITAVTTKPRPQIAALDRKH